MYFSSKALISALFIAGCSASLRHQSKRELSFQLFQTYSPGSSVTDHAAIDLDQQEIETHLSATPKAYGKAQQVYENGAHSKSYAELTLSAPLTTSATAGAPVEGKNSAGETVSGKVYENADANASTLKVQYATSDTMATYVGCQVGGSDTPNTSGCFASSGTISIGGQEVAYSSSVNKNGRTIQGFSTGTDKHRKNGESTGSFYEDFDMFQSYYGATDYADKWIKAALSASATNFPANGNANFAASNDDARDEAITKGTAYMSVFMYIIRELEDALDDCERGCDRQECNADPVNALDEAVAFYTGSLTITEGGNGLLLFGLANKRCENFATCGTGGIAKVNEEIFVEFNRMQNNLLKGDCPAARKNKEMIASLMYVPMIQGTLRYAYRSGEENDQTEKSEAEGATFAAAVLPKVHACNAADANTIYENMKIGNTNPADFVAVKRAFERNYRCMGISCSDVGGLSDGATYFAKAAPCSSGFLTSVGLALGIAVTTVVALL